MSPVTTVVFVHVVKSRQYSAYTAVYLISWPTSFLLIGTRDVMKTLLHPSSLMKNTTPRYYTLHLGHIDKVCMLCIA